MYVCTPGILFIRLINSRVIILNLVYCWLYLTLPCLFDTSAQHEHNIFPSLRVSKMSSWPLESTPVSPRLRVGAAEQRAPFIAGTQQYQGRHCILEYSRVAYCSVFPRGRGGFPNKLGSFLKGEERRYCRRGKREEKEEKRRKLRRKKAKGG